MLPIFVWACLSLVWGHFLLYLVSDLIYVIDLGFLSPIYAYICLYSNIWHSVDFQISCIPDVFCGFKSFHLLCLFYLDYLLYLLSQYSILWLTHFICKTCPEFSETLSFSISFLFNCEFSSIFLKISLLNSAFNTE